LRDILDLFACEATQIILGLGIFCGIHMKTWKDSRNQRIQKSDRKFK